MKGKESCISASARVLSAEPEAPVNWMRLLICVACIACKEPGERMPQRSRHINPCYYWKRRRQISNERLSQPKATVSPLSSADRGANLKVRLTVEIGRRAGGVVK